MAGADETHLATMGNGIDDMLPVIDQPGLQGPGRHPGCRFDAIAQVLGTLAQVFRGSLGDQVALVQHEDLGATLRLVHVGGTDQHAQPLLLDQLLDDLPELTA